MTSHRSSILALALGAAIGTTLLLPVNAEMVDPSTIKKGDVGPLTPYGETPQEAAAKKTVFLWNYTNMVERKPKESFEKYVSKDYCNHGHLSTGGQRECMGYEETLARWVRNYGQPLKPGEKIEIPYMASVNGEMVTMYGAGVDIFRVHDGKITDHWDASPPEEAHIKAHAPGFLQWMMGERKGPPPGYEGPSTTAVTVDEKMIKTIDVGPLTPYAETAQEKANKRTMFEFNHMVMIEGKPKEAYEMYVSKDYCNHSHLSTNMKRDCANYDETLQRAVSRYTKPAKVGDKLEIPTFASVDGEMVTMYGAGVDIFRVHNGKITDHWDASPPAEVTIAAHPQAVVDHMIKVVAGEAPVGSGPGPGMSMPVKK